MKNLLLVLSIAFLGACSNYTTGTARHQCCADAMANGKQCCETKATTDAKSMSAGAAGATKECSAAASSCESAAAASCSEKSAMSCCDEAKAASKECADCVKP